MDIMEDYENIKPFRVSSPVVVEMTFYRTDMCEKVLDRRDDVIRLDARTLVKRVDSAAKYGDLCL